MSVFLRILMMVGAIFLLIYMIKKIRQSKLKIDYSIFWFLFACLLVVMGFFPNVFYWISDLIGFQAPINMVYLIIIFVLIMKLFLMSIQISQLENKVDNLTQQVTINLKISNHTKKQEEL